MQTAVIILGMHRSGTSSLVGSLQQKGLFLGEVFEWSPFNLKGNRENEEIMKLNDSVLISSNGSWDNPPEFLRWEEIHKKERNRIIKNFTKSKHDFFGFKDPRTMFTLPFWKEGLSVARFVGTFRHPLKVAKSLNTRNGLTLDEGLHLWKQYNNKLLMYIEKYDIPLANFDVTPKEYYSRIDFMFSYLGMNQPQKVAGEPFFDESLVSNKTIGGERQLPRPIMSMYNRLLEIYENQTRVMIQK